MMKRALFGLAMLLWISNPVMAAPDAPASPAAVPSEAPASPQPTPQPQPTVRAIWDYQKEIGLSDDQILQIKKTIKNLQTKANEERQPYMAAQSDLGKLMEKDSSDLTAIKAKMLQLANIEIDMKLENIKAVRTLHKIMTAAQLSKWKDIQQAQQHGQQGEENGHADRRSDGRQVSSLPFGADGLDMATADEGGRIVSHLRSLRSLYLFTASGGRIEIPLSQSQTWAGNVVSTRDYGDVVVEVSQQADSTHPAIDVLVTSEQEQQFIKLLHK